MRRDFDTKTCWLLCGLECDAENECDLYKRGGCLSSGEQIACASDESADYAISKKIRALLGGLRQSNDNARMVGNMMVTAENALHEVMDSKPEGMMNVGRA